MVDRIPGDSLVALPSFYKLTIKSPTVFPFIPIDLVVTVLAYSIAMTTVLGLSLLCDRKEWDSRVIPRGKRHTTNTSYKASKR